MSTIYRASSQDTFEGIARKVLGDSSKATLIATANPGQTEPIAQGAAIIVPGNKRITPAIVPDSPDRVTILLNDKVFDYWTTAVLTRAIDTMDTVELEAPFDPNNSAHRIAFKPFSFQDANVYVGEELIFTGTAVGIVPDVSLEGRIVTISAYSRPGVLGDCTPPASDEALEFSNYKLDAIARSLAAPFDIGVVVEGDIGAAFDQVKIDRGDDILSFLAELAKQRNLVITNTPEGDLLILRPDASGQPGARLVQGQSPMTDIQALFSPQAYFSHITGVEAVVYGFEGSQHTVKNARLAGVLRPHTYRAKDVLGGQIKTAVEAKAARMFGNMLSYNVTVNTWQTQFGRLWEPNRFVTVVAPDAMIYSPTNFLIRSVSFEVSSTGRSAVLDLVLPGSFSGQQPEAMPWD